jgi:hypothetical protein
MGGLGNQMFQYAAGRSLACFLNTKFKMCTAALERHVPGMTSRHYALNCFNIREDFASPEDITRCTDGSRTYYEPHFDFDRKFFELTNDIMLEGYWQSEKYFSDIRGLIQKEFSVKAPLSGENLDLARKIQKFDSVSIHIRRGDYVANPKTNQFHGICSLDYYQDAAKILVETLTDPHFFVFSDDHEWPAANLALGGPTKFVINNSDAKAFEDLRLMSMCEHHILANSSFSWWGAWLNERTDKIVIAPKQWFSSPSMNTNDLLLKNWRRI